LGLFKGKDGSLGKYVIERKNGSTEILDSKCTVNMMEGDILIVKTPGGGGYGSSSDREAKLVLTDVLEGRVSSQSAFKDYGVNIDWRENKLKMTYNLSKKKMRNKFNYLSK
jgi:N-methylhydantoinase B/oxoprolinase/acetone carboxylase alpha subunit